MSRGAPAPLGAAAIAAAAVAVGLCAPAAAGSGAPGSPSQRPVAASFALAHARVTPRRAYFAGRPVSIGFAIAAPAPLDLRVDVVREATRRSVRTFALAGIVPGAPQAVAWDGLTAAGAVAPNGRYRARVSAPDGSSRDAARFELRSHIYPIRGRHADRGPIGQFGVGRNGGRIHEGYDVDAACGTPVVAARGGIVTRAAYDPVLYGNIIIVRGERTQRDYWYSHLLRTPRVRVGDRVLTGQRIGSIGQTGNARSTPCHLHFELRSRGRPIDPEPELRAWDRWS